MSKENVEHLKQQFMKAKGHNICDTLKAIRKQIADANGIDYSPEECHFTGECKGTCPKCEQDVRYLEHELRLRLKAGKAIKVAGVALGIIALAASITSCSTQKATITQHHYYQRKLFLFASKNTHPKILFC